MMTMVEKENCEATRAAMRSRVVLGGGLLLLLFPSFPLPLSSFLSHSLSLPTLLLLTRPLLRSRLSCPLSLSRFSAASPIEDEGGKGTAWAGLAEGAMGLEKRSWGREGFWGEMGGSVQGSVLLLLSPQATDARRGDDSECQCSFRPEGWAAGWADDARSGGGRGWVSESKVSVNRRAVRS